MPVATELEKMEEYKIISVRNFRICYPLKMSLFEILGAFQKLLLAIILGVRIFRVFEILENLPYLSVHASSPSCEDYVQQLSISKPSLNSAEI